MATKPKELKVWYGFRKLTKKLVKKKELIVIFENSDSRYDRKMSSVTRHHIAYERFQTPEEVEGSKGKNRELTTFSLFIDKKPFFGDIEKVLEENYKADENNVSAEEREIIKNKLREFYKRHYNDNH